MNVSQLQPPQDVATLTARFHEILRGVNIDETTFQVDETDETRGKESVAILSDVIDELNAFTDQIDRQYFLEFVLTVHDKISILYHVHNALYQGKYFSSMDDVWEPQEASFEATNVKLFDRTHEMLTRMDDTMGYIDTINGANDSKNVVTDDDSHQSRSYAPTIFGTPDISESGLAHLLPHSPECASLWYHLVPWVLCRLEDIQNDDNVEETGTPAELANWMFLQKCIHGFKSNTQRQKGVGIKHFPTNSIHFRDHKNYFDGKHCPLLIVPVMRIDHVKHWNGSGYNAIVLAGNFEGSNDDRIALASQMYRDISAHKGKIILANEEECGMACKLLETMVLCIGKSSRDTFSDAFHENYLAGFYDDSPNHHTYIKKDQTTIPVPSIKSWNNYRVRRITFSNSGDVTNNPAPDPVLLLGKAASNWLRFHGLSVLPGYDGDYSSSSSSDSSSDSAASLRDELVVRGWSYDTVMRPSHIEGLEEVTCRSEDVDEPLSDDDE